MKDICDRCGSKKTKVFWDLDDGSVLCDECHEKMKSNTPKGKFFLLIILSLLILSGFLFYQNNQLNNQNTELALSFENYVDKTSLEISLLKADIFELENDNSNLKTNLNDLSSELSVKEEQYDNLKSETLDTISLIEDYKKELQDSMEWFNINSDLTDILPRTKKSYLEKNCLDIKSDTCEILTACFSLMNDEKLDYVYKFDDETSGVEDKLQSLTSFMENEGGDCEDYALFFKAEWNLLLEQCEGKDIIVESYYLDPLDVFSRTRHYVDHDHDWYLVDDVNEISFENYKFPNVICGNMYDLNSDEINGHCMIALTKQKISTLNDLELLKDSVIIEPQTGEFRGKMNKIHFSEKGIESTYLEPYNSYSNSSSFVYQVITDFDHYSFSYDSEEWQSYSYFFDILDDKSLALNDLI